MQAAETSSHWRTVGDETLKPTALKTLAVSRFLSFVDNNKIAGALSVVRATIVSNARFLQNTWISGNDLFFSVQRVKEYPKNEVKHESDRRRI